jgi:hypothetical protein
LKVFSRHELTLGHLAANEPALLLEGSWSDWAGEPDERWSLDDCIDSRFGWIDDEAAKLSEELTSNHAPRPDHPLELPGLAWLDALRLRYELVKLLRVVAFFESLPAERLPDRLEVYVERDVDHDYEGLLRQIAGAVRARLTIVELSTERLSRPRLSPRAFARRVLSRWTTHIRQSAFNHDGERIVLCGNPRVLDAVCADALQRNFRVWWLYERLAVKHYFAWRSHGVEQLVCDDKPTLSTVPTGHWPAAPTLVRDIDLSDALRLWCVTRAVSHGARYAGLLASVWQHFAAVRPTRLILDEDCSALQRAAVAAAQHIGASSVVVQHGIPAIRFGYTPLTADRICVWNDASQKQMEQWGVPIERTRITGSPALLRPSLAHPRRTSPVPTVLLLWTTPANPRRPDAVNFHLTTRSERQLLRSVCQAIQGVGGRLVVRMHPRRSNAGEMRQIFEEFPGLPTAIDSQLRLDKALQTADCVLSCGSTAGYEALLAGLPVIQVLPPGSGDLLPDAWWGWRGTARDARELEVLLRAALAPTGINRGMEQPPEGATAARRIVDEALSAPRPHVCAKSSAPEERTGLSAHPPTSHRDHSQQNERRSKPRAT